MSQRWLSLFVALAACDCPPVHHDDHTYVAGGFENEIDICAKENSCLALCVRAFQLDPDSIDSCKIASLDGTGGAMVDVRYHEYICTSDDWDVDVGIDDPIDDCSDGSCDPPPDDCSDGSCDPPPDDPPDDPPPDDPPPDDPPPDDPPPDDV